MKFLSSDPQRLLTTHLLDHDEAAGFVGVGIGKTGATLDAINKLFQQRLTNGVLVMAPMRVANLTWPMEVNKWDDFKWMKVANLRHEAGKRAFMLGKAQIYVCNYEGIPNLLRLIKHRRSKGLGLPYDTLVADECFAAGTIVDTDKGKKPIEEVREGDCVKNAVGVGFVTHVSLNTPTRIVHLHIHGSDIWCSGSHLFLTPRGWVAAERLTCSDQVLTQAESVRVVRRDLPSEEPQQWGQDPVLREEVLHESVRQEWATGSPSTTYPLRMVPGTLHPPQESEAFLRDLLLSEMEDAVGTQTRMDRRVSEEMFPTIEGLLCLRVPDGLATTGPNSESEAYAERSEPPASQQIFEGDGAQAEVSRRERETYFGASECAVRVSSEGRSRDVVPGVHLAHQGDTFGDEAADPLQAGHGLPTASHLYRGGWLLPQQLQGEKGRCEEDRSPGTQRVESVEIYESTDPRLDCFRSPDGLIRFYDLSVSGHPSYSVNGLLVHNCTRLKNPSAKRPQAYRAYVPRKDHQRVWALTGTPAPNSLLDLFAQIRFADGGKRLGVSFEHFKQTYFKQTGYGGYKWTELPGSKDQIEQRIADMTLTLRSKDWLDIPETLVEDIEVPLGAQMAKEYKDFEKQLIMEVKGKEITAANAAALVSKLLQFTSGAIYDSEKEWHRIHDLKLKALEKLVKGKGPVLVACSFRHEQARIRQAFPQAKFFDDAKSANSQMELLEAWNAGKVPMLVAHPKSVGHGLNLQHGGNVIVWFTLTYSREDYEQMIARLARRGQEDITYVYRLMCPDTVDYAVATVIEEKRATEDRLLTALQLLESYREGAAKPVKLKTEELEEDWI